MKLKIGDLYNLSLGVSDLATKELPIGLALKVQRVQKTISEELISSDKVRQSLIEKYKEKTFENGDVQIDLTRLDEYNEKISELMDQEIEINIDKINMTDLEKTVDKIKPRTLMQIETIINAE